MRRGSLTSWVMVCSVVLLCSSVPALSGVHLWRITESFSNASGTIQFIEMTTCCGSAGGEIFLSNQPLSSNSHTFTFPANLTMATPNKHVLLATSAFAALAGAPVPDYIIVENFFSPAGDTLTFSVYDTVTFPTGVVHPTDGTNSLNKLPDDMTDTTFAARNSPTNLHEQTGSVTAVTGPPAVPDGTGGTRPLTASLQAPDGSGLQVSFDVASCTNAADRHIIYGEKSGLPTAPGGVMRPTGSVCAIGNTSPYDWLGVPQPTDGFPLIWFLLVTTDANGVEGSWGVDSAGLERVGPGNGGASGTCAVTKNAANTCGHP
jgi:hypothetical protein